MDWLQFIDTAANLGAVGYSIYSAEEARKAAEANAASAGQATSAMLGLSEEQAKLAREQWDRYKSVFGPLEEAQVAEAAADIGLYRPLKQSLVTDMQADIDRAKPLKDQAATLTGKLFDEAALGLTPEQLASMAETDARASFARTRANEDMERLGRGVVLKGPAREALARKDSIAEALGVGQARTSGFVQGKQMQFDRLAAALDKRPPTVTPMGQTTAPSGNSLLYGGTSGLSSAASTSGSAASTFSNLSNSYLQSSAASGEAAGNFLGMSLDSLKKLLNGGS